MLISQNCNHKLNLLPSAKKDYFLNIGATPWNYDISDDNWIKFMELNEVPDTIQFVCIARKVNFNDFDQLPGISRTTFETLMSFLSK